MSLLSRATKYLTSIAAAQAGAEVTYARGAQTLALAATRGRTVYEAASARGVVEQRESIDWIVDAADLVLDGETVTPARGDRITDAGGNVYEVAPLVGSEQHYRPLDPAGSALRIHTRVIA